MKTRTMNPYILAGILYHFFPFTFGGGNIITGKLQLSTCITFLLVALVDEYPLFINLT
ncbi:hypothetical protein J9303_16475 [Bacillaceae bacterium Marseille-Q3522]|nr:hypothetical protein [Bacillaceae bacterium Marseille-Q3522]